MDSPTFETVQPWQKLFAISFFGRGEHAVKSKQMWLFASSQILED
jgi:hypothetical protein